MAEALKDAAAVAEQQKALHEAMQQKWKAQAAAKKHEQRTAFIKYMRDNNLKYNDLDPLEKKVYDDMVKDE